LTTSAQQFEKAALPHLSAAYNLARWLVRDDHLAQDMVQEACIRGLKYFSSFHGEDIRPWLLSIVRNTCFTWLKSSQNTPDQIEFDEDRDTATFETAFGGRDIDPEAQLLNKQEASRINLAISSLPPVFREVLVLRELEGLSYEDIATVAAIPVGTVMSRLARARSMLRTALFSPTLEEAT
jgi:RNA polymerase sigma-70 factor (ECF subfamily)